MSVGMTPETLCYDPLWDDLPETEWEKSGLKLETGAPITGAVAVDETVAATSGDGNVRFFHPDGDIVLTQAHKGVVLCIAENEHCVLTGGDDGQFLRISPDGRIEEIANFGARWVDCVAARNEQWACSSGKFAHIWRKGASSAISLEHASTVGGLAFDRSGERLAVAHYGGVSVWERVGQNWKRSTLNWKGSHGTVSFSPDGNFLVSSMQENALHGWRLVDKTDMAMAGYPAKIKSVAWVGDTPHLVTSGAKEVICWPYDGTDGPMGRAPLCLASGRDHLVTCVQSLNAVNAVFAGFQDGVVLLSELDEAKESIVIRSDTHTEVTAIAVTKSFSHLLIGDADGHVLWTTFWRKDDHE